MKKVRLPESICLIGIKNFEEKERKVDYYMRLPYGEPIYAFFRKYSNSTYDLCKSGIRINDLMRVKSKDYSIMRLVGQENRIIPFLADYYNLDVA